MILRNVSTARLVGVSLLATSALWGIGATAQAAPHPHGARRRRREGAKEGHKGGRHGVLHGSNYHPPFAAIVVDDNTGQTIYEVNADEPRHPASLTKVMTLYMLFEAARGRQGHARHAAAGLGPLRRARRPSSSASSPIRPSAPRMRSRRW